MAKHKPLTQFERGYLCAVSCLIHGHGAGTEADDVFMNLGVSIERVFADKNLDDFDKQHLKELKDFKS